MWLLAELGARWLWATEHRTLAFTGAMIAQILAVVGVFRLLSIFGRRL